MHKTSFSYQFNSKTKFNKSHNQAIKQMIIII